MEPIVKVVYKKDLNILKISCNGKAFDVARIKDIPIEQWVFPFCSKGVKWNGLYEELKVFTERNDNTLCRKLQLNLSAQTISLLFFIMRIRSRPESQSTEMCSIPLAFRIALLTNG